MIGAQHKSVEQTDGYIQYKEIPKQSKFEIPAASPKSKALVLEAVKSSSCGKHGVCG